MVVSAISCERILLHPNDENTASNNFELLWDELDKGYVFFDYKGVDWEEQRSKTLAQIDDQMSDESLFQVLATMLESLRDGHVSLSSNFMNTRFYDVTQDHEANFNKEFVIENYLVPNDMDTTTWIRHCFLEEDVAYLYYSTFTNEISEEGMAEILNKYKDTKGLIIDVRGNFGGDAGNIRSIMQHFVKEEVVVGLSQEKKGEGKNDLTNPKEIRIAPKGISYQKPIIVLSNRGCYSACNAFVAYMSTLPNVTILGDDSGGGAGLPVANQLLNGWTFTYSATVGSLPNGFILEDGLEPDVEVFTDEQFETQGLDNIIEEALARL